MEKFKDFKVAVQKQFHEMSNHDLFVTDIDKDKLWDTYLNSFPPGTNNIFRERREYDCQHCKQFIRACGNVVAIIDNKLVSIWDIEIDGHYKTVSDAMSNLVKAATVKDLFLHYEKNLGTDFNHQMIEGKEPVKWEHFHYKLPKKFVKKGDLIASTLAEIRSSKDVFKRGIEEISIEAAETVLELIEQKSIYRGEEFKSVIELFIDNKKEFMGIGSEVSDNYCWIKSLSIGSASKVRNTAIGTLLVDISEGVELDPAVKKFESKVAPTNYKRPTALITKSMIKNAEKKVSELGIETALNRRYAVTEDITINNVLFADRVAKKTMNVFDELTAEAPTNIKNLDKIDGVDIEMFINDILPKAESLEMMVENKHSNNLLSLIAPIDKESKNIFKWDNNFSWAYNGEVADSLREKVKALGGRVDGVFRFTHSWNEIEPNKSLMDLHVFMPANKHFDGKCHDNYGNNERVGWNHRNHSSTGGVQDVDYVNQAPKGYIPVENITFPSLNKMPDGEYVCKIHNWNFRGSGGRGKAEIEFGGNVYHYVYPKTKHKEWLTVAKVTLDNGEFSIKHILPESNEQKEIWGMTTQNFHKVKMVMNSPNHWDGNKTGNKHYFFMLENCLNDSKARGFFNEFLNEDLREHRKVFEVLGSKMKTEKSDNQLSGLGFSTTQKNSVLCKVSGSFSRVIKINF